MINLETKKFTGTALFFLLAAAIFCLFIHTQAGDVAADVEVLKLAVPKKGCNYLKWGKDFISAVDFLANMDKELHQLNLSIEGGFYGHKAGQDNLYKLNIESVIIKDIHPHTFNFKFGTSIQFKNNILFESVNTLLLSYDHHLTDWFEFYGFMERFSDSFLSINQRYEIGCGFKFEFDFGVAKTVNDDLKNYERNAKTFPRFRKYIEKNAKEEKNFLQEKLEVIKKKAVRIKQSVKKKFKIFSFGMAFTIFSELEQAEIETLVKGEQEDGAVESIKRISLPAEQRFRFVVRPSLEFSPIKNLTLKSHIYYKLPLGSPYRIADELDLRIDSLGRIEYTLSQDSDWGKSVFLILEYRWHHDNVPPMLPESIITDCNVIGRTIAEPSHGEFFLKLAVQF